MPIFDYKCHKCNDIFELMVSGIPEEAHCPDCGEVMERKYSPLGHRSPDRYDMPGWKK